MLQTYYKIKIVKFRKACYRLKNDSLQTHFTKFSFEINDADDVPTKMGVIGYGRLGSSLCRDLLESKFLLPENLYIQTRNIEKTST